MPIIAACHAFLTTHATGQWYETYCLKDKETHGYLHTIQRGMAILRVEIPREPKTLRVFYWFYNLQDAIHFNEFVGTTMKKETHELIITPRCRMFYDIDLELTEFQQAEFADHFGFDLYETNELDSMDEIGKRLATVVKDATLISFAEHGISDVDLAGFDWMFTMRNRSKGVDRFKISIHLITNIIVPLAACVAISDDVRNDALPNNINTLGISEIICDALVAAIDVTQYHNNGSLSLPFSTKEEKYTNWIIRPYNIPHQRYLLSNEDQFSICDLDLSGYNIVDKCNIVGIEANPDFVKAALAHVNNISDYDPRVWDINASILKRSTMYVKRYAPSMCSICKRYHDSDNTLFLIFNSELGIASWKCARCPTMKAIVFYEEDLSNDNDDELSAFAKKHSGPAKKCISSTPTKLPVVADADIEVFAKKHTTLRALSIEIDDPFDVVHWQPPVFYRRGPALVLDTNIDWKCDPSATYTYEKKASSKSAKIPQTVTRKVPLIAPPKELEEYGSDEE